MRKLATRREYIVGVILALFVFVGTAWAIAPSFRADGGIRFKANATAGTTGTAANPTTWSDATTKPNMRFSDGTADEYVAACAVTTNGDICQWNGTNWIRSAGSAVSWPLQNGTSPDTFNYGGTFGGTTRAYQISSTNNPSGLGDDYFSWEPAGTKRGSVKYNSGTDNFQIVSPSAFVDFFDNNSSGLRIQNGVSTQLLSAAVTVVTATQASVVGSGSNSSGTSSALWTAGFHTWESTGALNTLASAGTITPTVEQFKVSGTAAIATIAVTNLPTGYNGCVKMIPTGIFTTTTAGNISLASTAVVNKTLIECWDGTKWNPSY